VLFKSVYVGDLVFNFSTGKYTKRQDLYTANLYLNYVWIV